MPEGQQPTYDELLARVAELEAAEQLTDWRLQRLASIEDPLEKMVTGIWEQLQATGLADRWAAFVIHGEELIPVQSRRLHPDPTKNEWMEANRPQSFRLDGPWLASAAFLADAPVRVTDLFSDEGLAYAESRDAMERRIAAGGDGTPSVLAVPLHAGSERIGVLSLARLELRPFTDEDLAAIQPYADQMALAIGNARAADQLEERNRELAEALSRQTAVSEILSVISRSPADVQVVLDTVVRQTAQILQADRVAIQLVIGERLGVVAAAAGGQQIETVSVAQPRFVAPLDSEDAPTAWVIRHGAQAHTAGGLDAVESAWGKRERAVWEELGVASATWTPLKHDEESFGLLIVSRASPEPFTSAELDLLQTFADQAVIAIENARLFNELQERNREVTAALDQQTAMSEVLGIISRSATDAQPVLQAISESASRLCNASRTDFWFVDGDEIVLVAGHGVMRGERGGKLDIGRRRPIDVMAGGRAILERRTLRVDDTHQPPEWLTADGAERLVGGFGRASIIFVPLLRGDEDSPGVLTVSRDSVEPFTDGEVTLIETFAAQAVIALENARLFNELQERNREVAEALDVQTVLSEVLGIVAGAPTNPDETLPQIALAAQRLCDATFSVVGVWEDGHLRGWNPRAGAFDGPTGTESGKTFISVAVAENRVVQVCGRLEDWRAEYPGAAALNEARGMTEGAALAVPIPGRAGPAGAILVTRDEAVPFVARHIQLLQTLADQAVIAIENARLFNDLQESNREVAEALDVQTVLSEVLGIVAGAPTDLEATLPRIAEAASRLCAGAAAMFLVDGDQMRWWDPVRGNLVAPVATVFGNGSIPGLVLATNRPASVHGNIEEWAADFPVSAALYRDQGLLDIAALCVPIPGKEGAAGGIIVRRPGEAFTPRHQVILQTLAQQAVIAIENARLFNELQESNREVGEALDQQTAVAEVLQIISSHPGELQVALDGICLAAARLLDSTFAYINWTDGDTIVQVASALDGETRTTGTLEHPEPLHRFPGVPAPANHDVDFEAFHGGAEALRETRPGMAGVWAERGIGSGMEASLRTTAGKVGVLGVWSYAPGPFSAAEQRIFRTFAQQAVIAIENARLFNELQARNREVSEALEQQDAFAGVLRVISESPAEMHTALDAIARASVRLVDAFSAQTYWVEGDEYVFSTGWTKDGPARMTTPVEERRHPLSRKDTASRAMREKRVLLFDDLASIRDDPEYADGAEMMRMRETEDGWQLASSARVPILRGDEVLGCLSVTRSEVRPFSEAEVALLQTFADQAAIAITNARLFQDLQASNANLETSLEYQTATSEVLGVVGQSAQDSQPVFEAIVEHAARLSGAEQVGLRLFDEGGSTFRIVAARNSAVLDPEKAASLYGRAFTLEGSRFDPVLRGETTNDAFDDVEAFERAWPRSAAVLREEGLLSHFEGTWPRADLTVPLMLNGAAIGGLILTKHRAAGPFDDRIVRLMQTFAAQAVIAIENARLFREQQEAVEQITATAEVLEIISKSPTDITPVGTAIAERIGKLMGADNAAVHLLKNGVLRAVAPHKAQSCGFLCRVVPQLVERSQMARPSASPGPLRCTSRSTRMFRSWRRIGSRTTPSTIDRSLSFACFATARQSARYLR